jgi:hypothetical protein
MNGGKVVSGIAALSIYLGIIFLILFFYNIHKTKAKNYVEKNSDRVTVTLVNSNKTVFNKSSKVSTPKKPVPVVIPPVVKKLEAKKQVPKKEIAKKVLRAVKPIPKPKKHVPKKVVPKKHIPKKHIPKKHIPKKVKPKKVIPKKIAPKKAVPKKHRPKKIVPKKIKPKKHVPKKIKPKKHVPKKIKPKKHVPKKIKPKKKVPKKHVPKKKVPKKHIPKKPKKSAKDLFSSVKTKSPVKRAAKQPSKRPAKHTSKRPSSIKHNSSITDRIKATHQSGRASNANRDKGIKNAYVARVKRHMNNWNAIGAKGQMVTIHLTVYNSGKFRYTASGVSGAMKSSLKRYLNTLNRMGLGRHKKSTPYSIQVRFRVH